MWAEKTKKLAVSGPSFEVKTSGLGRLAKGIVIDMTKVNHNGYRVSMKMEDTNYIVVVQSNSAMKGTAKVHFYVNAPWKRIKDVEKNVKIRERKSRVAETSFYVSSY